MIEQPRIVAVLPVRSFATGKQRLSGILSQQQRTGLIMSLAAGVLQALQQSGVIAATAVVSSDPAVQRWAASRGAVALPERTPGLNEALERSREWALDADQMLVVLPDLPLLAAADVRALAALAGAGRAVFAPDRHHQGTNALLIDPRADFPFAFGGGSLARHQRQAAAGGFSVVGCASPGFALDLDTADDLAALPPNHRIARLLRERLEA